MHNYHFSWTETIPITMYIYSISHEFYIQNTQTTIFMTRFHDNNWLLSLNFNYFFHEMSQKMYWLKECCKYIISMKFGDSMTLISNFGKKCQFYETLYAGISARAGLPSSKFWPMVNNGSCITNMQRIRKSLSYLERYGQRNMCNFRKNEKLAKRQVFGVICPWPVFSHDVDTYEFWSCNIKVLLCTTSIIASIPHYKNITA